MEDFIKRLFCRHEQNERVVREIHVDGKIYRNYGNKCKSCGKTRWL